MVALNPINNENQYAKKFRNYVIWLNALVTSYSSTYDILCLRDSFENIIFIALLPKQQHKHLNIRLLYTIYDILYNIRLLYTIYYILSYTI